MFCTVRLDLWLVSFERVDLKKRQFVDHLRVYARAGDGGNGVIHFRREKYVPIAWVIPLRGSRRMVVGGC